MLAIERQPGLFDYDALAPTTKDIVQRRTGEIQDLMRRTAADIVDIGLKLIEVKSLLGHGNFGVWLESEFGWSYRAAARFMQVAGAFKSANLADLDIAPSALYALASGETPEPIRQEFMQRAQAGETVAHKAVKERLAEHREQFKPLPPEPRPVITIDAPIIEAHGENEVVNMETGEITPAPVFSGPEVTTLTTPDPDHVIRKNEVEQALENVGYDDASRLDGVLGRAVAALSALQTYSQDDLERIVSSAAGEQFRAPYRLSRVQELCADFLRVTRFDDRTIDA